jgi:hypothetical protein
MLLEILVGLKKLNEAGIDANNSSQLQANMAVQIHAFTSIAGSRYIIYLKD